MDVLQLTQRSGAALQARPITHLNDLTRSATAASARWDEAMNRAVAERDARTPVEQGINGATATPHQRSINDGDLNYRMRSAAADPAKAADAFASFRDELNGRLPAAAAKALEAAEGPLSAKDAKLEQAAQTLVNQFFMGSMMKQMRNSPFKNEAFTGGKAGAAYAGMFDQHVAEHSGNKIAKSLVSAMLKAYQKQADQPLPTELLVDPKQALPNLKRVDSTQRVSHDAFAAHTA